MNGQPKQLGCSALSINGKQTAVTRICGSAQRFANSHHGHGHPHPVKFRTVIQRDLAYTLVVKALIGLNRRLECWAGIEMLSGKQAVTVTRRFDMEGGVTAP